MRSTFPTMSLSPSVRLSELLPALLPSLLSALLFVLSEWRCFTKLMPCTVCMLSGRLRCNRATVTRIIRLAADVAARVESKRTVSEVLHSPWSSHMGLAYRVAQV